MSLNGGSSGRHCILKIILDVGIYLRMSAGATLLRTGSQPVLVYQTAPTKVNQSHIDETGVLEFLQT